MFPRRAFSKRWPPFRATNLSRVKFRNDAYADKPLPIGEGQTISQPYMVAAMTEALELTGSERVLEIGTGSGYQAAVLSLLVEQVITVESHTSLALAAQERLTNLGYANVHVHNGDGSRGLSRRRALRRDSRHRRRSGNSARYSQASFEREDASSFPWATATIRNSCERRWKTAN